MLLGENITLAITSLKSNKMRALLTMLGIIIGIAAVIAIFTVGNSLTISIEESLQSMGSPILFPTFTARSLWRERRKITILHRHSSLYATLPKDASILTVITPPSESLYSDLKPST